MKTIIDRNSVVTRGREQAEVVDLDWAVARISFEVGFYNEVGAFDTWSQPAEGVELVRVLKNVYFISPGADEGNAQVISVFSTPALIRLRDKLNEALPNEAP